MKKRKITVSIDSTYKYIQLWNGIFDLTNKETNICSVRNKKEVARIVGIKDYNTLNNYIKKFKDKGAIIKKDTLYTINPFLNPDTDIVEITIKK